MAEQIPFTIGHLLYPYDHRYAMDLICHDHDPQNRTLKFSMRSCGEEVPLNDTCPENLQPVADYFRNAFEKIKAEYYSKVDEPHTQNPTPLPQNSISADEVSTEFGKSYRARSGYSDLSHEAIQNAINAIQDQEKASDRLYKLKYPSDENKIQRRYSHELFIDLEGDGKIKFTIEAGDVAEFRRVTVRADYVPSESNPTPDSEHIHDIQKQYAAAIDRVIDAADRDIRSTFPKPRGQYNPRYQPIFGDGEVPYDGFVMRANGTRSGNDKFLHELLTPEQQRKFGNSERTLALCTHTFAHDDVMSEKVNIRTVAKSLERNYGLEKAEVPAKPHDDAPPTVFESRVAAFFEDMLVHLAAEHAAEDSSTSLNHKKQCACDVLKQVLSNVFHEEISIAELNSSINLAKRLTPFITSNYPTNKDDTTEGDQLARFVTDIRNAGNLDYNPLTRIRLVSPLFQAKHGDMSIETKFYYALGVRRDFPYHVLGRPKVDPEAHIKICCKNVVGNQEEARAFARELSVFLQENLKTRGTEAYESFPYNPDVPQGYSQDDTGYLEETKDGGVIVSMLSASELSSVAMTQKKRDAYLDEMKTKVTGAVAAFAHSYQEKKGATPLDENKINKAYANLITQFTKAANSRPDNNTAQFLLRYFGGDDLAGAEGFIAPESVAGKQQALDRLSHLQHALIAYDQDATQLDSSLVGSADMAATLEALIDTEIRDRAVTTRRRRKVEKFDPDVAEVINGVSTVERYVDKVQDSLSRRQILNTALKAGALGLVFAGNTNGSVGKKSRSRKAPKDPQREAFIERCTQVAGQGAEKHNQEFGAFYDELARKSTTGNARTFAAGVGTSEVINRITSDENYAERTVDALIETLAPRIDAIVDWNTGLGNAGFVEMASGVSRSRSRR